MVEKRGPGQCGGACGRILEEALGRKAEVRLAPLPPGDVVRTCADIAASTRDLGFEPRTAIEEGLPRFVAWYREYHGV
ncbi:MAG: hypothetical protein ACREJ5_27655 [Geminicoccaceae bacterium]